MPKPGDKITAELTLVERIGAGGMGSVWRAQDLALDRQVAVKFITAEAARGQALERFRREATLAAKIRSPHVVEVHSHGVTDRGAPYMVMEVLAGQSLAERLKGGARLEIEAVCAIVDQVARALTAAHALGVVHRDIKPGNLFLIDAPGYDQFVKVLDFGVAKPTVVPEEGSLDDCITAEGVLIGTPRYMSPEQLTASPKVDHRTDLWALAVVAYQALTGELPFVGSTLPVLTLAVGRGEYTPPSARNPELGKAVDRWFERAWRFDPSDRFADADELARTFRAATLAGDDVDDSTAETRNAPIDPPIVDETVAYIAKRGLGVDSEDLAAEAGSERSASATRVPVEPPAATNEDEASEDEASEDEANEDEANEDEANEDERTEPAARASEATKVEASTAATTTADLAGKRPSPWWFLALALITVGLLWRWRSASSTESQTDATSPLASVPLVSGSGPTSPMPTAPRTLPRPSATAPTTSGRLPPEVIQSKMRLHLASFRQCLEMETIATAVRRTVMFTIDSDGVPRDVIIAELTMNTPSFDACLIERVGAMRFPAPKGGVVTVAYPLLFTSNDDQKLVDNDCHASPSCAIDGQCTAADNQCVVATDADCSLSLHCASRGLCRAKEGRCVTAFSECGPDSKACAVFGLCQLRDGLCAAETDNQCRQARACKGHGHCKAQDGACIAGHSDDCQSAGDCATRGLCDASEGWCTPASHAHCRASRECGEQGACTSRRWRCVAGSDADCAASRRCAEDGNCKLGPLGICQ